MSITISDKLKAEGPFESTSKLQPRSGVYIILTKKHSDNKYTVVDVGESHDVKERVSNNHPREKCWLQHKKGVLAYAAYYTPHLQKEGRREIEREIRDLYEPPCGER